MENTKDNKESIAYMLLLQEGIKNAREAYKASHGYGQLPRLNIRQIEMVNLLASGDFGECVPTCKKSNGHFAQYCSQGISCELFDSVDITIRNPFGLKGIRELTFTISTWMISLGDPYKMGFNFSYESPREVLDCIRRVVLRW